MKSLKLLPIAALLLAIPVTAQVTATVSTGNAGGISLTPSTTATALTQNWANPKTFTTYEYLYKFTQTSTSTWYRDYVRTYVSPPRKWYGYTYNYVSVYNYAYFRKGTKTTKGGTTKDATGAAGAQIYNINLTGSGKVTLDLRAYASIYGNSKVNMTLKGGTVNETWSYSANGYNYKNKSINLTVTNSLALVFTVDAQCDRSGNTPGAYYDGFYSGLYMNVLENSPGSFTVNTLNDKCGGGTKNPYPLVGNGTPQKGLYYNVDITGMANGQACAFLYGFNNATFRTFIKLPLPLDYMGATNCSIGVDFYYPWSRKADASGKATMRLYLSRYYARTYYIQGMVIDPKANTAGFVLTNVGTLK